MSILRVILILVDLFFMVLMWICLGMSLEQVLDRSWDKDKIRREAKRELFSALLASFVAIILFRWQP